jgi:hypothetical protein
VGCSCRDDNTAKDICDSWVGIWNRCCGVGMNVGLRMTIAMVDAIGMCG